MRTLPRILALSIAALACGGTVFAQDVQTKGSEVRTVYEGLDAQGRIVRVTVTPPQGNQAQENQARGNLAVTVATPAAPELHWTAHIGSGNAASIPH